jgi:hypothetical protein
MPIPPPIPTPRPDQDRSELPEDVLELVDPGEPQAAPPRPLRARIAIVVAAALSVASAGGLLAYRAHHRARVLRAGLDRASSLLRVDTAAGYRDAAALLEPLAAMDPVRAGGVRAYALAMRFADYRDAAAGSQADALLAAARRDAELPVEAHLASAALFLGRREPGNAASSAARTGFSPEGRVIAARVALLSGNLSNAYDAATAAASARLPAALALRGDVLRRMRQDPDGARGSYAAALAASPLHPRAAFGVAKLALSGFAPAEEAERALRRLIEDRGGTPEPERGRAALHLAALRLRAGDRAGAADALGTVALEDADRSWAQTAAAIAAGRIGWYRAVEGAPPPLRSASDDDPGELPPVLAPPAPAAAPVEPTPAQATRPVGAPPARTHAGPGRKTATAHAAPATRKTAAHATAAKRKKAGAKAAKDARKRRTRTKHSRGTVAVQPRLAAR